MVRTCVALLALAIALPGVAFAHDHKPKHGGLVKETAGQVYELRVTPTAITVWVTDEADKPVRTTGASATVTLVDSAGRVEVPLVPAGDNRFSIAGTFAPRAGMSALLVVAVGGQEIARLRYVLK